MKTVKSLLLGSAVGFVSVSVGQAADLPIKAKPVEYVKVCSLYGEGFWYIPGTDTCIKIGGFVRVQFAWNAGNNSQPLGQGTFSDVAAGYNTRTDTNALNQQYAGVISVDVRTPTEYGTLRSYMDLGTQATSGARWGGAMSGLSVDGSIPSPVNSGNTIGGNIGNSANNYFNEATFVTRAFIQFAGVTAGRIRSFFDINSMGPYDLSNNRIQGDTAGGGINGIAYTAQLGNGISASVSLEDGGNLIYGRGYYVTNMNLGGNWGTLGAGATADNSVPFSLDPVAALRIDQAWGYAQVSGALHGDSGGYYGGNEIGNAAGTTGVDAGHPGNRWGWATAAGFTLNNFLGLKGDTAGVMGAFCMGAEGYCSHSQAGSALIGSGNRVTYTVNEDAMYTTGGQILLTRNFDVTAFYEHYWNPKWRTSLFGGWLGVDYSAAEISMVCPAANGGTNPVGWNTLVPTAGTICNPNYNTWQIGSRTMWNPHPYLDIGVEVLYTQLNQSMHGQGALASTTVAAGAAGNTVTAVGSGALNPGLYNFANQGVWSGMFRIQRNFLY
jgi:Porin subfamily